MEEADQYFPEQAGVVEGRNRDFLSLIRELQEERVILWASEIVLSLLAVGEDGGRQVVQGKLPDVPFKGRAEQVEKLLT